MSLAVSPRPSRDAAVKILEAAGLPVADLTDAHMEHFLFCGPANAPAGLVGFEPCGADALLRSLVVVPTERSHGVGKLLVARAEQEARTCGVKTMWLLTTTAEQFFLRRGYVAANREQAPEGIRSTREFAGICPASSAFMMKRL